MLFRSPLGITASDRAILELLARETASVSLSELARKNSMSRQHIHQSIRRLPNSSWVESVASPGDHRIVLLHLTREGRAFWKKVRAVDRRFNRARYDAQATVDAFAQRLRDAVDLDAARADLLATVQGAVEPAHVSVWMRPAGSHHSTSAQTPG